MLLDASIAAASGVRLPLRSSYSRGHEVSSVSVDWAHSGATPVKPLSVACEKALDLPLRGKVYPGPRHGRRPEDRRAGAPGRRDGQGDPLLRDQADPAAGPAGS